MLKKIFFPLSFMLLFSSCSEQDIEKTSDYIWDSQGISFSYEPTGFNFSEGNAWIIFEESGEEIVISKSTPVAVDMDFVYTRLKIYPNITIKDRIEEIKKVSSYRSVEALSERKFSGQTFSVVHIHSSLYGENDTNFYLTELNGGVFEYQAGINDYELIGPILSSLSFSNE